MMAQAMRAGLFANATATTSRGFLLSRDVNQGSAFNKGRSRGEERAYCSALRVRGAELLSEYLLFRALALVRARSLFVDLDDGLTPSATA
jgi:hypothetical protein